MSDFKVIETQKYKIMIAVIIGESVMLLISSMFIGSVQREALDLQIDKAEWKDKYEQLAKDTEGCLTDTCLKEIR